MCLPGRWNGCERDMSRFMYGITHLDEYKGFKNTSIVCTFQLDGVFVKRGVCVSTSTCDPPSGPPLTQEETFIPCWFLTSLPVSSRMTGTLLLVRVLP